MTEQQRYQYILDTFTTNQRIPLTMCSNYYWAKLNWTDCAGAACDILVSCYKTLSWYNSSTRGYYNIAYAEKVHWISISDAGEPQGNKVWKVIVTVRGTEHFSEYLLFTGLLTDFTYQSFYPHILSTLLHYFTHTKRTRSSTCKSTWTFHRAAWGTVCVHTHLLTYLSILLSFLLHF